MTDMERDACVDALGGVLSALWIERDTVEAVRRCREAVDLLEHVRAVELDRERMALLCNLGPRPRLIGEVLPPVLAGMVERVGR